MYKGTKIISEISNFFQENQKFALFQAFSMLVEKMNVSNVLPVHVAGWDRLAQGSLPHRKEYDRQYHYQDRPQGFRSPIRPHS